MATKKKTTQAERVTSSASKNSKSASIKSKQSKNVPMKTEPQETAKQERKPKEQIPSRLISSLIFLTLFVVFLVVLLKPDGVLTKLVYQYLVLGMFGSIAFYFSIPAFLYMFFIHAFSGKRPILMRSICLGGFVLICGCISHLLMPTGEIGKGLHFVADLYRGGIHGNTAGLICGSVSMLLRWLCGDIIAMIILIVSAILTLLGSMQITIPSIVRAVRNRPRAEWEDEQAQKEKPEPAVLVVNHIAKKRIEYVENKQKQQEEQLQIEMDQPQNAKKNKKLLSKGDEIMRQIEEDTAQPVAASEIPFEMPKEIVDETVVSQPAHKEQVPQQKTTEPLRTFTVIDTAATKPSNEPIPADMPELDINEYQDPIPTKMPEIQRNESVEKVTAKQAAESAVEVAMEIAEQEAAPKPVYHFPPISLLRHGSGVSGDGTAEMKENSRRLNETLASFKIEAHIINVTRGPSVTRYEVELDKGVRLNKLTSVADDIALSLGASGVRIAAVPGKISIVGIEVPNRAVTMVSLREVIDSPEFNNAKSKSSFAVGKDIGGNCIVGNIAKLPHMLIAGTTGSGKSVCMNSIIISLLYKASPEDVKLIMIDPKMVELGIYNAIPHLLIPVVTDPKKAAGSLQWAVTEMMRRYKSMSDAGVRDLESYNSIMESEGGNKLPQVVVIIDELADLMLVAAKEVEESICRIAQMGRAAGIHLVIATQRPSADVITGLMKANIPSRIAFAVASAMESRIILDTMGAEKLVGKGDMLFSPIGSGKPLRVQGCFVSDPEVEAVANFVKDNFTTNYDKGIMDEIDKKAAQTGNAKGSSTTNTEPEANDAEFDGDEMLPAAVDVILETGQASVSMLQRRLKLGYARAARIVDEMEEKGIVGPFQGSKPRTILVTKEQWASMRSGQPEQMDFDEFQEDMSFDPVPEEID